VNPEQLVSRAGDFGNLTGQKREPGFISPEHTIAGAYCSAMVDENSIRLRYEAMHACLDERGRRLFAAAEARTAGHGGIAAVARRRGLREARSAAV
jgi:hypothetical protein